jgi:hypothetical protein
MSNPKLDEIQAWLNPYAVTFRYPGDVPDIPREDAEQAIIYAREIWGFIVSQLPS